MTVSRQSSRLSYRLGRLLVWATVIALALCTTAGTLALWQVTHGSRPSVVIAGLEGRQILAAYVLLLVTPWWALLSVMFMKLNWLASPVRTKPAPRPRVEKMTPDKQQASYA